MEAIIGIVVALVLGVTLGAVAGWWRMHTETERLREVAATAEVYKRQLDKREAELEAIGQQRATEQAKESAVLERLAPVSKSVEDMQQKITELEAQRRQQHHLLTETIGQLQATTNTLAGTLTKSQERGRWGEVQLEQIFESAGLIETVHFEKQTTATRSTGDNTGYIRPDFLLKLPNGRVVPIDAKVPFERYDRACEIPLNASRDELERREAYLKEHAAALKQHVQTLARKEYGESLPGAPDFVVAFLPAEALLSAALEADPTLIDFAFRQRIALASPVTLWSIVKSIAYAWQQEEVSQSAQEILDAGKELLRRIATVAAHSTKLKGNLEKTVKSYNDFARSLERNLLTQADRFQKLDVGKELPIATQIDTAPHAFTKPELTEEV
ncbi:MAG: DNA recombination protein RmuC [Coriobacteriia bacterium]|nr:DNA recombination protein RmuC [Coriobacteriia bacterium]